MSHISPISSYFTLFCFRHYYMPFILTERPLKKLKPLKCYEQITLSKKSLLQILDSLGFNNVNCIVTWGLINFGFSL